ncbi:hypothetical protein Gohar_019719, partial [Gossypium harknessii]|nr:hypothetical protein [Gossypium harknessii]
MAIVAMIAQHFEATIKNHPNTKLRKIQRRCASEMHVNVTIDCCYRVNKIVKEKMAGNHNEEFGLLWDYTHELTLKMSGRTIRMAFQRVTVDFLPHFKRYYVCFDALKRGWKAGCRQLIGLDSCFLKCPFKNEFLTTVWFLSLLSNDLGLEHEYGYTIISDQQK